MQGSCGHYYCDPGEKYSSLGLGWWGGGGIGSWDLKKRNPTQTVWVDGPIPRVQSSTWLSALLLQHSDMLWPKNLVLLMLGNTHGQMVDRKHGQYGVTLHPFVVWGCHVHGGLKSPGGTD